MIVFVSARFAVRVFLPELFDGNSLGHTHASQYTEFFTEAELEA